MIPKSRPGPRDRISSTTSSPAGPPTSGAHRPGQDHLRRLAAGHARQPRGDDVEGGVRHHGLERPHGDDLFLPGGLGHLGAGGGKPLPHRPLGRALGAQQGQHVAGGGRRAGLEGQLAQGLHRGRVVHRAQDLGPAGPRAGPFGGDIEALVPEVHRSQQGLFAQVAAAAVAGVPQHEPVRGALGAGPGGQGGAQAHAHHEDLPGPAGPQQVDGGAHRPSPGRAPVRVAGPAGRIAGAVVVDVEHGQALGREPLAQGAISPRRPLGPRGRRAGTARPRREPPRLLARTPGRTAAAPAARTTTLLSSGPHNASRPSRPGARWGGAGLSRANLP